MDPRHRPRRDRDPDAGRARAASPRGRAARSSAARRSWSASGSGASSTAARSSSSSSGSAPRATTRTSASRSTTPTPRRCCRCSSRSTRRATSTATATWSTGTPGAARRSPTSRSRTARSPTRSTTSTTRWRRAAARSRSPPCAPRRCWPTPRSRCTPTTSATARLIGEKAILPLVGRKLKIIADEYVKPEFGTGALKITPGHDPNDFEIGRRHGLAQISVIGEDGRITDEAPERFVGLTVPEAQRRGASPSSREQGLIARTEDLRPHGPVLAPLRRADRAADLAAVVHADGRAGRAGDRGGHQRPDPVPPRALEPASTSTGWRTSARGASRASCGGATGCRSGTGRPARDLRRRRSRPRATAGSATPTCSTPGSRARCGRSRRSAGPSDTPELRAFYPTDVLVHRPRHHLPVGRADDHDGARVHRRDPVRGRLRALDHPGARRPADVEVAGHRDRPAGPDRRRPAPARVRRGQQAPGEFPAYGADAVRWGLLAMSSAQDVRFSEDKVAQGQQLTNKLWNASRLILLGVGAEARAAVAPDRRRGPLDPLAPGSAPRTRSTRGSSATTSPTPRCALYDFVYGELCDWYLELVKPRLRAGEPELPATLLHVLTADARARAPDHPVRDRGDLQLRPGRRGAARRGRPATGRPRPTPPPRPSLGAVIDAVQALRAWRDAAGGQGRRDAAARGWSPTATSRPATQLGAAGAAVAGRRRRRRPAAASVAIPGGTIEILAGDGLDLEAADRAGAPPGEPSSRPRSSAPSASSPTRGSWPRRPPTVVAGRARQARAAAQRAGGAVSAADAIRR